MEADEDADRDDTREPWHEGPDEVAEESWLSLDDDALLHRVETLGSEEEQDERLLEVVRSSRHFFLRQEAAKRVRDRRLLFAFEEDRHVGQILVRHLNRREDLTYLERLASHSRHVEVRSAAQVQLARVWRKLEAPVAPAAAPAVEPSCEQASAADPEPAPSGVASVSSAAPCEAVDASLLGWAAHFVVEHAWRHLGTTATRELLRQTQRELLPLFPTLGSFTVTEEAHVAADMPPGARFPHEAVRGVAAWMTCFRSAARQVAPDVHSTSIRGCTGLMADALRETGFYAACDAAEASA